MSCWTLLAVVWVLFAVCAILFIRGASQRQPVQRTVATTPDLVHKESAVH